MKTVLTFGTFDVFHVGHLRILERAAELGDRLVVGVSSDELNISKKGRAPVYPQHDRIRIVAALNCVDAVFVEESLKKSVNTCLNTMPMFWPWAMTGAGALMNSATSARWFILNAPLQFPQRQ